MIGVIQKVVRGTDAAIARFYLSFFKERNALVPFLFHSLFQNESEIRLNLVDPLQRTTVAQFRQFVEYYLEHGYRFLSPMDIGADLDPGERYAVITFDDGYYNNLLALPVLEEFKVPAIFFISTAHVLENKCYWWDVLYRNRAAQGIAHSRILDESLSFKTCRTDQIESRLKAEFGIDAFAPRGDLDRPFTPTELKEFARHPRVFLGNHTADHAILTNYSHDEMRGQIRAAQDSLFAITGIRPSAIAYPNGAFSEEVIDACVESGLTLGFTVRPEKQGLPIDSPRDLMRLGRFTPHGGGPIVSQCRTYRSDFLFYGKFRDGYLRFLRNERVTQ